MWNTTRVLDFLAYAGQRPDTAINTSSPGETPPHNPEAAVSLPPMHFSTHPGKDGQQQRQTPNNTGSNRGRDGLSARPGGHCCARPLPGYLFGQCLGQQCASTSLTQRKTTCDQEPHWITRTIQRPRNTTRIDISSHKM